MASSVDYKLAGWDDPPEKWAEALYGMMQPIAMDPSRIDVHATLRLFLRQSECGRDRRAHSWVPFALLLPFDVVRTNPDGLELGQEVGEGNRTNPSNAGVHTDAVLSLGAFSTSWETACRKEGVETFATYPASVHEPPDREKYECRPRGLSDAKGHLCFKDFTFGVQCIIRPPGSRHEKSCDRAMAFVLEHAMLTGLMKRIKDTKIQGSIMAYLSNRLADRQPSIGSRQASDDYLRGLIFGPFDVHQKVLILSALLGQPSSFQSELRDVDRDADFDPVSAYSVAFFDELSKALKLAGESFASGTPFGRLVLHEMMDNLPTDTIPDLLCALNSPIYREKDGLVASWTVKQLMSLDVLDDSLVVKEGTSAMQLCVRFHELLDWRNRVWPILDEHKSDAHVFGLALALQLVKSSDAGDIPQELARDWFSYFGDFGWVDAEEDLFPSTVDEEWDEETVSQSGEESLPLIDPNAIGQMVCLMVKMGWKDEVEKFLALGPCPAMPIADNPKYSFSLFSTMIRDQASNPSDWRDVLDVLRNLLLASVCTYILYHVQPEPRKYDRFRQRLRCRCESCVNINTFLSDDKMTRQIYPIFKASFTLDEPARADARVSFSISSRAVQHIVRQLSKGKFGCSYFTRMTQAAGPVFVIQKVRSIQEWQKWKERKEEAVPQLREILHFCLADVVSSNELQEWLSLEVLNRRKLEWTIPLQTTDPMSGTGVDLYKKIYGWLESKLNHIPPTKNDVKCRVSQLDHGIKLTWQSS